MIHKGKFKLTQYKTFIKFCNLVNYECSFIHGIYSSLYIHEGVRGMCIYVKSIHLLRAIDYTNQKCYNDKQVLYKEWN